MAKARYFQRLFQLLDTLVLVLAHAYTIVRQHNLGLTCFRNVSLHQLHNAAQAPGNLQLFAQILRKGTPNLISSHMNSRCAHEVGWAFGPSLSQATQEVRIKACVAHLC